MGMFDFFKKIITDKKAEEAEKEKIAFSGIADWIEKKRKEIENKEEEVFTFVKEIINIFTNEIKEKINILKNIDINSKREEDKIKSITEEGRKKYIEFVELFIKNLDNLQQDKLEKIIININKIFSDFNKNSHMSYERATILIGKEMGSIKDEIKVFSKNLIKVFDENKNIINSYKVVSLIKIKLKQLEETERDFNRVNETISTLTKKVTDKEEENKKILEEIEEIKKSPDYLEYLERLKKIKSIEEDLEKDFFSLRQLIDFKALGNFYHIFEKEIKIVNSYKDNFQTNFQKDNGANILNLLNQAKLNTQEISDKINQIRKKKEEIMKNETEIEKDKTQELYSRIARTITEADNLKNLKTKEGKRCEKLNSSKKNIIKNIKEDFEKIEVEIKP